MLVSKMSSQAATAKAKPKLIWLFFIHRHGDRTPLNMGPKDKYNDLKYWPEGFGNLDNAGRQRMYKLGQFIRRRYDNFLTDNFREVYSRSSDVDRCIESSHAVLAGLYPPTDRYIWNKDLNWIPNPVHSVPAPDDYILNEAGRKYIADVENEVKIIKKSDAVKKLYENSVEERALLERELGYDFESFYKFKCTYSTLDIEEKYGYEMPSWYTPELKKRLYHFAGIGFALAGGGTERLRQIRCGHLLDDILSRMELASPEGPKPIDKSDFQQPTNAPADSCDRKVIHYSTHDSIMAALLESLEINEPCLPPGFGATFFLELYIDVDEEGNQISEKYVKVFHLDNTESENPIEKKLPRAKLNDKGRLTLKSFREAVNHLLPQSLL